MWLLLLLLLLRLLLGLGLRLRLGLLLRLLLPLWRQRRHRLSRRLHWRWSTLRITGLFLRRVGSRFPRTTSALLLPTTA